MKAITKTVTTTYQPQWIKNNFLVYGPQFRKVRANMTRKYSRCFACNTDFKDGDPMALVGFKSHANELLCQTCAADLMQES